MLSVFILCDRYCFVHVTVRRERTQSHTSAFGLAAVSRGYGWHDLRRYPGANMAHFYDYKNITNFEILKCKCQFLNQISNMYLLARACCSISRVMTGIIYTASKIKCSFLISQVHRDSLSRHGAYILSRATV